MSQESKIKFGIIFTLIISFLLVFIITKRENNKVIDSAVDNAMKCQIAKIEKDWSAFGAYCPEGESKSTDYSSSSDINFFQCQKSLNDFLDGKRAEIKISNIMNRCLDLFFNVTDYSTLDENEYKSRCNKDNVVKYPEVQNDCELYKFNLTEQLC